MYFATIVFFKVCKEGRKGRRGKGKREKEKNYRWTVSKWDWKWCNFFASQAHPIWKPPPPPLPGNISLLLKNSPNPVPCPTWCWLSPFSFPVTNPDPIHHSRTPVLSNLRCTASSLAGIPCEVRRFQKTLYGKKRWRSLWEFSAGAPRGEPQACLLRGPRETHTCTRLSAEPAAESACSCPLLSCHWLGGDRPGMRECLHQPFPLRRASKLALLDPVTYLRMYFKLNYYVCTHLGLLCLSDEWACYYKSSLFLLILLFWLYSVCQHYSHSSFLLISICILYLFHLFTFNNVIRYKDKKFIRTSYIFS